MGVERPDKTPAFGNVHRFQGRPYDAETGLYYFPKRYLDPVQGRFISRDTIRVRGIEDYLRNSHTFVESVLRRIVNAMGRQMRPFRGWNGTSRFRREKQMVGDAGFEPATPCV